MCRLLDQNVGAEREKHCLHRPKHELFLIVVRHCVKDIKQDIWPTRESVGISYVNTKKKKKKFNCYLRCDWQSDTNSIGWAVIQFQIALRRMTARLTRTVRLNERHDEDSSCKISLRRREFRLMCSSNWTSKRSAFSSVMTESAKKTA